MQYGMLIDYSLCTGCRSCEVSCRKEHDLPLEEWGILVQTIGPKCNLCAARKAEGKKAACELHCLANVIEVLPVEDLSSRMMELGHGKVVCFQL